MVCTEPMLETTAKRPKHLSRICDESPSCHPLPVLPDELLLQILLRVPVRSLLNFKRVSKSWKTLISDPQFSKDHLLTSTADPNLIHQRLISSVVVFDDHQIVSLSMQSLFQNASSPAAKTQWFRMSGQHRILGSCNGLLCLCDIHLRYVVLWNPSTGFTSKTMPTGVHLGQNFSTYEGFGYDHVNDKYKLLLALEDVRETVTKIYTFSENSSCTVIQNFPCYPHHPGWLGKFVSGSGTLNWIAKRGEGDDRWVILSLDLVTETCDKVFLPDGDSDNICRPVIDVVRNCLCVCYFDSKKSHWAVWLMKEYGVQDSWTKLMIIPGFVEDDWIYWLKPMIPHDELCTCTWYPSLHPLCISDNGIVVFHTASSNIVLYNSNDGRLDYPSIRGDYGLRDLHIYCESLVSPQC